MVKDQVIRRRSLKKAKQRVPPAKLCACERDNALHSAQPSTPTVLTSSTLRKRDQHITLVCPMQLSFGSGRSHAVRNPPHASVALFRATDVVRQGEAKNVTETKSFDYTAATAALQRSLSRPVYAFHGHEICLNASFPQDCSSGASNPRQIALRGVVRAGYRAVLTCRILSRPW